MSTSSFSFNNDNSSYINLETILGCTVGSRAENGLVFLDEEKPCGEELEYLDEIERERNYEFGFCGDQFHHDSIRSILLPRYHLFLMGQVGSTICGKQRLTVGRNRQ